MEGFDLTQPRFKAYILPNAPLEKLAEGFRWTEGPVWFGDRDELLFSDLPNNRVMRWSDSAGLSVYRAASDFENGHARDRQGRLLSCSHRGRRIHRTELDGSITSLVERYRGRRLNSPNDIVCKSDGTIWFSDPPYGIQTDYEGGKQDSELPAAVYRFDPRDGSLRVVADDFQGPNGLCFSPDERRLYIVETGLQFDTDPLQHVRVFDVGEDGGLSGGAVFCTIAPGNADGVRCDEHGNLWSSAGDGVHCIDPGGELVGKIRVPATVANLTFGGRNNSRLFLCASQALYAIYVNVRGLLSCERGAGAHRVRPHCRGPRRHGSLLPGRARLRADRAAGTPAPRAGGSDGTRGQARDAAAHAARRADRHLPHGGSARCALPGRSGGDRPVLPASRDPGPRHGGRDGAARAAIPDSHQPRRSPAPAGIHGA